MMEFLTSRAALVICGAIVLSSVALPMCQIIIDDGTDKVQGVADDDARAIDRFYDSVLDVMYLDGSSLLPSPSYSMDIDGNILTITNSGGEKFSSALSHRCGHITLGYGDRIEIIRDGGIIVQRTSPRPS